MIAVLQHHDDRGFSIALAKLPMRSASPCLGQAMVVLRARLAAGRDAQREQLKIPRFLSRKFCACRDGNAV
jgi:hypothetical protein